VEFEMATDTRHLEAVAFRATLNPPPRERGGFMVGAPGHNALVPEEPRCSDRQQRGLLLHLNKPSG
jgi:hypothetical protein